MTTLKQKIYCTIHGWQEVIQDDTVPQTTCPINPADTVITESLNAKDINITRLFGLKGRAYINNSTIAVVMFYDKDGDAVKLKDKPDINLTMEDTTDPYTLTWLQDGSNKYEGFQLTFSTAQTQSFTWKVDK